jgi:CNT family concentrative nucleoside transporter
MKFDLLNAISFFGIFALCLIAWIGSENRKAVSTKVIIVGLLLQMAVGWLVFVFPITQKLVVFLNYFLNGFIESAEAGTRFLFGDLIVPNPATIANTSLGPAATWIVKALGQPYFALPGEALGVNNLNIGYIFGLRALPLVIFFSALMALLYRLGLIQPIIRFFAVIFRHTMGISGAEALAGATNIFVGIESAIAIKPFLAKMTRSEICTVLTACFGSIASTVLAVYAGFLLPVFPNITGHLVTASVISIPACIVTSKILVPETGQPLTLGRVPQEEREPDQPSLSYMDSLIQGALDGVKMAVSIGAVVIAIVGLVALLNQGFTSLGQLQTSQYTAVMAIGRLFSYVTLDNICGVIFFPLTLLTGISLDLSEVWTASVIIGKRILQTEIPAYLDLSSLAASGQLSDRALLIISYVLCGFTHLPSYGIFVGGMGSLAPSRRQDITALGWIALWGATLATLMTGCIAGVFFMGNGSILLGK